MRSNTNQPLGKATQQAQRYNNNKIMALRDQPYIPLYVKDFTSDEKLRMCSPSAVGVYIFLMCILHREREYGKLQLRQSFVYTKGNTNAIQNHIQKTQSKENLYLQFAENLAKQMPFKADAILLALLELDYYGVIRLEGDTIYQPRMVRDGAISETRRKSANKRWNESEDAESGDAFVYTKPNTKVDTNSDANALQNTEIENEYENNIEEESKGVQGKRKPTTSTQRRFTPPTLEEVMEYCQERNNGIDAIQFFDFYEANGWVQGKDKPLKDWKAAVRTWERNGVVTTNSSRNGQRTETQNATGRYCEVRSDTPAKATRHTTL